MFLEIQMVKLLTRNGSRNFHNRFKTTCGIFTTVDFLHFTVIKNKKFQRYFDMGNSNMKEFFVFDHGKVEKIDRYGSFAFFVVEVPRA
jgi:hypothetical protein